LCSLTTSQLKTTAGSRCQQQTPSKGESLGPAGVGLTNGNMACAASAMKVLSVGPNNHLLPFASPVLYRDSDFDTYDGAWWCCPSVAAVQ
jgi:hypothetical protein